MKEKGNNRFEDGCGKKSGSRLEEMFGSNAGGNSGDGRGFGDGRGETAEEKFGELFGGMQYENPPQGFEYKIMSRIDSRLSKRSLHRQWFYTLSLPILGVAAILVSLYLVTRYMGMQIDIRIALPRLDISSGSLNLYILLAVCTFLLLVADMLIRKHIDNKRQT